MYEKEIKVLLSLSTPYADVNKAIDTAIALTRAASVSPGNEAAELAHCERTADAVPGVTSWNTRIAIRAAVRAERAAVRAECASEIKFLRECGGGMRTEIERLRAEVSMYEKQRSMDTYECPALKAAGAPKDEAAERDFFVDENGYRCKLPPRGMALPRPKDEAAEHRVCKDLAAAISSTHPTFVQAVKDTRAAVRAECAAEKTQLAEQGVA
jgi:hypothetical protein